MATWKQVQAAMLHLDGLQAIQDEILVTEVVDQKTMGNRLALQKAVMDDPDVAAGMAVWAALGVDEASRYPSLCDALLVAAAEPVAQRGATIDVATATVVGVAPAV